MKSFIVSGKGQPRNMPSAEEHGAEVGTVKPIGRSSNAIWFEEIYTNVVSEVSKDVSRQSFLRAVNSRKRKRGRKL